MMVKAAAHSQASQQILGIRRPDEKLGNSNNGIAQVLNEHFSAVGEKLSNELLAACSCTHVIRVMPCVMHIDLSHAGITES